MKHATTDPDESITLNPEFTELLLFEAARAHFALVGYETPETRAVCVWTCLKHPDLLLDGPFKDHCTNPQIRSISLDQPAALLTVIDNLRAAFGDRLPGGTTPT